MFWADTFQKLTWECTRDTSAGSNNTAFSCGWCVAVSGCALAKSLQLLYITITFTVEGELYVWIIQRVNI